MEALSEEYLKWLDEFTEINPTIISPSLNYDSLKNNIIELYEKLDNYCKNNFYYETGNINNIHSFRHNDNYYVIKKFYAHEVIYILNRVDKNPNFIDICNLRKNELENKEKLEKCYLMKNIIESLRRLYDKDVPMDLVQSEINKEIKALELKKIKD